MGEIALLNENVPTHRINLLGQFIQFAFVVIRKDDAAGIADPGYALRLLPNAPESPSGQARLCLNDHCAATARSCARILPGRCY